MQFQKGNEHYYCWVVPNRHHTEFSIMITKDVFSEFSYDKYQVQIINNKILVKEPNNCDDKLREKIEETLQLYLTKIM